MSLLSQVSWCAAGTCFGGVPGQKPGAYTRGVATARRISSKPSDYLVKPRGAAQPSSFRLGMKFRVLARRLVGTGHHGRLLCGAELDHTQDPQRRSKKSN